jgi:hypothetical protein
MAGMTEAQARRQGYVLLVCLIVVIIGGLIVAPWTRYLWIPLGILSYPVGQWIRTGSVRGAFHERALAEAHDEVAEGAPVCGRCGQVARGHAQTDEVRYCHSDDERPSCYEREQWERAGRLAGDDPAGVRSRGAVSGFAAGGQAGPPGMRRGMKNAPDR